MRKLIVPRKPILADDFYCSIKLKQSQVNIGNLKSSIERRGFKEQINRHITIIGGVSQEKAQKALKKFSVYKQKKLIKEIKFLLKKLKWQYEQKSKIYHLSKKGYFGKKRVIIEHRGSYIRIIEMPDVKKFYAILNKLLQSNIPSQFPHITLFTKGERPNPDYYGIGVPSKKEFKRLSPKLIKDV